ncbi:hypothetical protein Bpfe_016612 [Biomphalaria pfeifferi]|uniref:Tyrosine-protein kinase ephrin type A/B receptor-like domain-containing protein n=1 Tax=Biomphalaria pfeifferi TaxID=112525 RepID=A0AAD8F7V1_BIOPF|nr:hypothetical protein Bpfe_016612 [Biomphalaria pfeifferi]
MKQLIGILLASSVFTLFIRAQENDRFCDPDVPSRSLTYKTTAMLLDSTQSCGAGQYFNQTQVKCLPCPSDTFMTKLMSEKRFASCLPCLKSSWIEIQAEFCTETRDTTVMCTNAYFRPRDVNLPCASSCSRCEICGAGTYLYQNYEFQKCQGYDDTICCNSPDMKLVNRVCMLRNTPAPLKSEDNGSEREYFKRYVVIITLILALIL